MVDKESLAKLRARRIPSKKKKESRKVYGRTKKVI